ncbi:MAG: hypothetical protein QOC70_1186 [Verrucomicrobiota bacterium]|jgi:hypothetical protein
MKDWLEQAGRLARTTQHIALVVGTLLCAVACAGAAKSLYPPRAGETPRTVYVINHGALHTGLAVRRSDIPRGVWPAQRDYSGLKYLEVGWGDDDGYRKPLTSGIALKALAGSKRTVLLSDGFNTLRAKLAHPKFSIIEVDLSAGGFARLCRHIEQTYALDEAGRPIRLGKGWYRARGAYSAFHTCNTWVAEGLRQAGCPITPAYCLTPGPLLRQTRRFGRVVPSARSR